MFIYRSKEPIRYDFYGRFLGTDPYDFYGEFLGIPVYSLGGLPIIFLKVLE